MKLLTLLSILTVLVLPAESLAQASGPPNAGAAGRQEPGEQIMTRDTMSQADLKRLAEKMDQWNRVDGTGVPARVAKARTGAMLTVLKVPCAVSTAAYRGKAPNDADQHVYEAACEDGMGYLLMLKQTILMGASCFEADQEGSPVKCTLPANADSKMMAGAVLTRNKVPCTVQDVRWLGTSVANLDHVEVACEGNVSHVVRRPRPGESGKLEVVTCQDASTQGIACKLSPIASSAPVASADARPTLSWFKEELARHGVSCQTKRARIVGRESVKRRYLVEFECSERADGLVAFVPAATDKVNSFESMNCVSAAERGIRCELIAKP
jgi:hypothetical protein